MESAKLIVMMLDMQVVNPRLQIISAIVRSITCGSMKFTNVVEIVQDMPISMPPRNLLSNHVLVLITLIGMIKNLFAKLIASKSTIPILTVFQIHQNVSVETLMTGLPILSSVK